MTTVDDPKVIAELQALFAAYESALMDYDPDRLDAFFWKDARVARYGEGECLYGHDAIAAFRRTMTSVPKRALRNTRIHTYGRDFATADTEFVHDGETRLGRQTQNWVRFTEGWRIVSAHVSFLGEGTA
ncbi:MAG: oxalurate catabolism protein HpxZ [Pseudomonadota bacterium]